MARDSEVRYYVLYFPSADEDAVIDEYPPGPESFEFSKGIPLVSRVEPGATVRFSDKFAGRRARDFQPNTLSAIIASSKAREVIERLEIDAVELLPVTMLNHRGKAVPGEYAIVNLLGCQPAIDLKTSDVRMSPIDPTSISRIKRLSLAREAIAPEAKMFRCAGSLRTFLIRQDVKDAFEAARLTGYVAVEAESWNGLQI